MQKIIRFLRSKKPKDTIKLSMKTVRGSISIFFIILLITILGILLAGGVFPKPPSLTSPARKAIPDTSGSSFDEKKSLQLETLKFKECLESAAVTLQIDITDSMSSAIDDLKNAAYTFTDNLSDESIIGIQAYSSRNARLEVIPVSLYKDVKTQIRPAVGTLTADGRTPSYDALNFSREVLERAAADYPERKFSFIFFSDGNPNVGPSDTASISQAAAGIKNLGVTVYAIGLGNVNSKIIEAVASSPDKALTTTDSKDLERIYSEIRTRLCD